MKVGWRFVLAAGLLLAMLGSGAEWIHFPLSAPVKGIAAAGGDANLLHRFPAGPFLFLLIAALAALLTDIRRLGGWLLVAAIAALLSLPLYALFMDSAWLQRYMEESTQYDGLQYFVTAFVTVPNAGFDQYLHRASEFQYLSGRGRVVVAMLGWGWSLCIVAVAIVLVALHGGRRLPAVAIMARRLFLLLLAIAATGVLSMIADFRYRQGDQRLGLGDYAGALESYTAAIADDPFLGSSEVFLLQVAKAYYQKDGRGYPEAELYVAIAEALSHPDDVQSRLYSAELAEDNSPLGSALTTMAQRKAHELWVQQSLQDLKHGSLGSAAVGLRHVLSEHGEWRHVRFFLASILAQLREFDESKRMFYQLLSSVDNRSIKANVYNSLGDVCAAAGDQTQAREAYASAYSLDNKSNLWAIKGLGGT